MSDDDKQAFDTGPRMIHPAFGMAITAACLALAAAQTWTVTAHYIGARSLAAHEPAARAVFGAVFLIAAFGILVALLEHRNGRVYLDDDGLTACCWLGCRTRVEWDEIASIGVLATDETKTDIPFHWLHLRTRDGRDVRLAGGPWTQPRAMDVLPHELADRLNFERRETEEVRWALLFPATRTEWRRVNVEETR